MRFGAQRQSASGALVLWAALGGLLASSCAPHAPQTSLRALSGDTSSPLELHDADRDAPFALTLGPSGMPVDVPGYGEPDAAAISDPPGLEGLSDEEIEQRLEDDPCALGSLSLGKPNGGALVAGVQMPEGEGWEVVDASRAWATQETIDYLIHAITRVKQLMPGGHPLYIGHLSREGGGPMRPHRSHQSGRDADISYFYKPDMNPGWYQKASKRTLDLPRTWALLKTLITETDVEYVFITTPVQRVLRDYAESVGEDREWLDEVFQYRSRNPEPIIRHAWGHTTHMHVRFFNPKAQALGQRAFEPLTAQHIITPGKHHARYKVQPGDDITSVARRFGTSPESIRKMNGLRTFKLMVGRVYTIPTRGYVRRVASVDIPARRLPPVIPGVDAATARAR